MLIIGNNRGNRIVLRAPDGETLLSVRPHGRQRYIVQAKLYGSQGRLVATLDEEIRAEPLVRPADGENLLSIKPVGDDYLITGKLYDKTGNEVAEINEDVGLHILRSAGVELG